MRCTATTKKGSRCKANAVKGKALCIFHKDAGDMRAKRMYAKVAKSYRRKK